LRITGDPKEIALGFALGIFIGMTPTMGVQIPLSIFAAALLKWNKVSAAMGVFITNPLTAPFVYGITYAVGAAFMAPAGGEVLPGSLDFGGLISLIRHTPRVLWTLTVGGLILGIPLSVVSYYLSLHAIIRHRRKAKPALHPDKSLECQKL